MTFVKDPPKELKLGNLSRQAVNVKSSELRQKKEAAQNLGE